MARERKGLSCIPNATGIDDAVETVLHEVVGHKGLRALFGDEFDKMLNDVWSGSSKEMRKEMMRRALPHLGDPKVHALRIGVEEYMAEQAERGFDDYSLWEKVKGWFKTLLRSIGLDVEISDNEIRYMLWRSYNLLQNRTLLSEMEDFTKQLAWGVGDFRIRSNAANSVIDSICFYKACA